MSGGEALDELAAERRRDVVRWRVAASGCEPHRPEPWVSERAGREPRWVGEDHDRRTRVMVGFDADERPVIKEIRWQGFGSRLDEVWRHGEGWSERITPEGTHRIVFEAGRVVAVEGPRGAVERFTYVDGLPVRSQEAIPHDELTIVRVHAAELDPDGRVRFIRFGVFDHAGTDVEAAHAAAAGYEPDEVVFDFRLHRLEASLRPSDELVELLVPALEAAVVAAVGGSGVPDPFVVELRLREDEFPPFARIGGHAFRERMTSLSAHDGAPMGELYKARPPQGATLELVGHLSDDALRACRELNVFLSHERPLDDPERKRASEVSGRIGRALSERLNQRDWPGAVEPFLALVHFTEQYRDLDPTALAARTAGGARVKAFRDSLRSRAAPPAEPSGDPRTDRESLAQLLEARGIDGALADHAVLGYRLVAGGGPSRLGGPPLLPPGEDWPRTAAGRPLSFLAGISLPELANGWLLFFADLDNDDAEGLIEPEEVGPGAKAQLLACAQPVEAKPPADLAVQLAHRPVDFEPTFTLPDDYEAGERLGLDPAEEDVYTDVASRLRYGEGGYGSGLPDHWVLGAVTGAQGHPAGEDTVLLLHMTSDSSLRFEYLDGGVIQFRVPAGGDLSRAVADADSG